MPDAPLPNSHAPANLVVTYHYVRPVNSDGVVGVCPRTFDRHIRAIGRHYDIVTAPEFIEAAPTTTGLALITFDDGVSDQFDHAFGVLESHDAPAVFFVPMRPYDPALSARAEQRWIPQHLLHALGHELGWERLEQALRPQVERRLEAPVDEARMNELYHYELPHKRWLKYALAFGLSPSQAKSALDEVNRGVGLRAEDWFVTAEQLVVMQDAGHTIGGHGYDHVPYSTLSRRAQAADLHRAARIMNELLTPMPRPLAYPFGRSTDETEAIARGAGYTRCFTTADRVDARDVASILPDAAPENEAPTVGTETPAPIEAGSHAGAA